MRPIRVVDHSQKAMWCTPGDPLLRGIPIVRSIIENIAADWAVESRTKAAVVDPNDPSSLFAAVEVLGPSYIRAFFSYVTFLFMAESGYKDYYRKVNALNRELKLYLEHGKPPARPTYVKKLWQLRNVSIAHWCECEKDTVDEQAGRYILDFSVSLVSDPADGLEQMRFGHTAVSRLDPASGKIVRSMDRITKPIPEMHKLCSEYLDSFQSCCVDYLTAVKARLPLRIGDREYSQIESESRR